MGSPQGPQQLQSSCVSQGLSTTSPEPFSPSYPRGCSLPSAPPVPSRSHCIPLLCPQPRCSLSSKLPRSTAWSSFSPFLLARTSCSQVLGTDSCCSKNSGRYRGPFLHPTAPGKGHRCSCAAPCPHQTSVWGCELLLTPGQLWAPHAAPVSAQSSRASSCGCCNACRRHAGAAEREQPHPSGYHDVGIVCWGAAVLCRPCLELTRLPRSSCCHPPSACPVPAGGCPGLRCLCAAF